MLLRDVGAAISPFNAFQFLQGLETLPLRIRQHNENAIKVAEFLRGHPKVADVIFPRFQAGEDKRRADAYFKNGGYGALVGFELKDGGEAGRSLHRRAASSSTTSPISATRARSPSIRRRRRIRNCRPRSSSRPA